MRWLLGTCCACVKESRVLEKSFQIDDYSWSNKMPSTDQITEIAPYRSWQSLLSLISGLNKIVYETDSVSQFGNFELETWKGLLMWFTVLS